LWGGWIGVVGKRDTYKHHTYYPYTTTHTSCPSRFSAMPNASRSWSSSSHPKGFSLCHVLEACVDVIGWVDRLVKGWVGGWDQLVRSIHICGWMGARRTLYRGRRWWRTRPFVATRSGPSKAGRSRASTRRVRQVCACVCVCMHVSHQPPSQLAKHTPKSHRPTTNPQHKTRMQGRRPSPWARSCGGTGSCRRGRT
jgi:hypothetical protein